MWMNDTTFDGYYLTSLTDTALFKDGTPINWQGQFQVITQADLQKQLTINPAGDVITIYPPTGEYALDEIRFGDVPNSTIAVPRSGESISLLMYSPGPTATDYLPYLDSTPTLGTENDSSGAMGYITGVVSDTLGQPLSGIKVVYKMIYSEINGDWTPVYTTSNAEGRYLIYELARHFNLGYVASDSSVAFVTSLQVWPGDTTEVDFTVHNYVGIHPETPVTPINFQIDAVFPNPFNSTTTVVYTLAENSYLTVSAYDVQGRLVDNISAGIQVAGQHKTHWNADQLPAGIYFIRLETPKGSINQKCIYLK